MNPDIEKLLVLQDRDTHLGRFRAEMERIPLEKAELDRRLSRASESVETAKSEAQRIETERKKLEIDAETRRGTVRKYKTQLLEIKNNDQFHALQHEIAAAEKEIQEIEDRELELMDQGEKTQAHFKQEQGKLGEVKKGIEEQRKHLGERENAIQKQVKGLEEERSRLAAGMDDSILERYARIARSKHGQGVVRISHGLCMGCHLKLTAQEIHDAQHEAELITCTNCGRILYWMAE